MRDKMDTLVLLTTGLAVLLAFLVTGERDYADAVTAERDAVTAERDALRVRLAACQTDAPQAPSAPARHLTRLER